MIPTIANDETLERYIQNIIAAWNAATPDQIAKGRQWYRVAHDLAEIIGNGDIRIGAGILAALSPNKEWNTNVNLAKDAGNGNIHGHFSDALRKVTAIINGDDPETVLPMALKTGHFFRCILNPEDPDPVVIDRWAYRVATGDWEITNHNTGLSNHTRYATLALAYRLAARRIGEIPSTIQSVTWIWAKETH